MTNYFEDLIGHFPIDTYTVAAGKIMLQKEGESATHFLKVGHTREEEEQFFSILNREVNEMVGEDVEYHGTTIWFTDGSYAVIGWQYDGRDDRYYFGWDFYHPKKIPTELL